MPPTWTIENTELYLEPNITYLGVELCSSGGRSHVEKRITQARKSFYSLQAAGMCKNGLSPATSAHLIQTVVEPSLLYGCECVDLNNGAMSSLVTTQGKLTKTALGLSHYSKTTPLIQALGIKPVRNQVAAAERRLVKTCILSSSATRDFYTYVCQPQNYTPNTLVHRVYNQNSRNSNNDMTCDGIIDSVKFLLADFNDFNRLLLAMLLRSF